MASFRRPFARLRQRLRPSCQDCGLENLEVFYSCKDEEGLLCPACFRLRIARGRIEPDKVRR